VINVILADDEPLALIELKTLIPWEEKGFRIIGAVRNGKSALDLLKEHPETDLAILDINMPVMTGLEVIEEWKKLEGRTEFLIISAYSDYPLVRRAFRIGATDYILKEELEPGVLLPLLEKIRTAVEKRKAVNPGRIPEAPSDRKKELVEALTGERGLEELFSRSERFRLWKLETLNCGTAGQAIKSTSLIYLTEQLIRQYYPDSRALEIEESFYLLIPLGEEPPEQTETSLRRLARELKSTLKKYLNSTVSISGGTADLTAERLPGRFRELKDLHRVKSRGILRAMDYIRGHYRDPDLNLEILCGETGLSRSHLSTLFKQETGLGYKDYLNEVRISHAIRLLETTEMRVQEVSDRIGFANVEHFSRTFKDRTGVTPSAYSRNRPSPK